VVPRISEFYGIAIYMYWRDHGPAHVHASTLETRPSWGSATAPSWRGRFPKMLLVWFESGWVCDKRNLSQTGNGRRYPSPFFRSKGFS